MTDRKLKIKATKQENKLVFDYMMTPKDIYCECSNGTYVKKLWKNANGNFGWDKWELLK